MPVLDDLREIARSIEGPMALGELLGRMERHGIALMVLFFSAPFLQPLPLLGLSTPVGILLVLLGAQLMARRGRLWLPGFVARRTIDARFSQAVLRGAQTLLELSGPLIRPRLGWFAGMQGFLGFMVALMALLLMLPIPVPFSNVACALPICLFAVALLAQDGLLAAFGLLASVGAIAYHAAILKLGLFGIKSLL